MSGFKPTGTDSGGSPIAKIEDDTILVNTLNFAYNTDDLSQYAPSEIENTILSDTFADFVFPIGEENQSFGYAVGQTEMQIGGSLMMAAGYERKGKSAAAGGVSITFDIYSRHMGKDNSESIVLLGWRHLVGDESSCRYN